MCGHCGCGQPGDKAVRTLKLEQDLLAVNNTQAEQNRAWLDACQVNGINLIASPGAGKTTLLVETLKQLKGIYPLAVIEGDQQSERDAERIRQVDVPAVQIQTGSACHLDASMVHHGLHQLPKQALAEHGLLFIENVGNLICPGHFALGAAYTVLLLSVTEGDDKPLKYPFIFRNADLLLITKTDLLPYVDFDLEQCLRYVHEINPELPTLSLSAKSGEGMSHWLGWLHRQADKPCA